MARSENINLEDYLAISRAVAGELDFQKVLNRIADEVQSKFLHHDHMDVAIVLPGASDLHVAFEVGYETVWGRGSLSKPVAQSPVRKVLTGELSHILTGDAWEDPLFHFDGAFNAPIFDANLHSRIHVPLNVHGVVHGSLNISSHRKNAYTTKDLEVARNIADLISPYIYALSMGEQARISALAEGAARGREQSLRLGAQRLTDAMEAERTRLGMDLHDQTLADLSAIYRQITRLAADHHDAAAPLTRISQAVSRCTSDLRGIIENAKPGVLDLFGLQQAIEAHLERAAATTARAITFQVSDQTDGLLDNGPTRIRTSVYRIAQEAITNAVRHSGCDEISVTLSARPKVITLTISNNGAAPAPGWDRSTGGVDNIRIRAALIPADVQFSATDAGMTVKLSIARDALTTQDDDGYPEDGSAFGLGQQRTTA